MNETAKHDTVLDTGALQLGRVYAQALISAAEPDSATDEVVGQLASIVKDVLDQSTQLTEVFASPRVEADEKVRVIERLFNDKVHRVLLNFLRVLAQRGRLAQLREISAAAEEQINQIKGRVIARVQTAEPLTEELRTSVQQRLAQILGKEVVLHEEVNAELLGGLVVRVGDTVFDSSVAGKLNNITQSARDAFARRLLSNTDSLASGS